MSKRPVLLIIAILAVSSLIMVESAFAQSIPKPSVPEFKLSYTNHVYDVPAAISQWSGEPIPNTAYHVDYREVIIKVKNQPYDEYFLYHYADGRKWLYYNVRVKNHFSNAWTELFGRTTANINGTTGTGTWYLGASDSEVTSISITLNGPTNIIHTSEDLAVGNQVDFQVKALIGYQNWQNGTFFGEESAWSDTQTLTFAESQTPTPSPAATPTIDVSCKGTATATSLKVEITGKLSSNGDAISGEPVLISYSVTGGSSWENLTLVNTDLDGGFIAVWLPSVTGNYLVKARWEGNATFNETTTLVNLALTPYSEQSIFSLTSNSTITEFAFNSTSKALSFTASGPSDTTGYVTVYIPKSLINDISDLTVCVDGNQITYSSESQTDSWVLSFTYSHSARKVVMDLSAAFSSEVDETQPPDFTIYIVISAVVIAAAGLLLLIYLTKRKQVKSA